MFLLTVSKLNVARGCSFTNLGPIFEVSTPTKMVFNICVQKQLFSDGSSVIKFNVVKLSKNRFCSNKNIQMMVQLCILLNSQKNGIHIISLGYQFIFKLLFVFTFFLIFSSCCTIEKKLSFQRNFYTLSYSVVKNSQALHYKFFFNKSRLLKVTYYFNLFYEYLSYLL